MIDEFDWGALEHAYGPAIDTPAHLRALTSADAEARDAATTHLMVDVLHGCFPASATAPAARIVTRILEQDAVALEIHRETVTKTTAPRLSEAMTEPLLPVARDTGRW